jgi:alpha-amylase
MTAVVFYFQVHQPYRLRRKSYFDVGGTRGVFDDAENERIVRRVAERCYLPMNALVARLIEESGGRFRCAYSLSGTLVRQLESWVPAALQSFVDLSRTGCVEFLCETSMHSLAALVDPTEFARQVREHKRKVRDLFGRTPTTFRNTELILSRAIARQVEELGFRALLAEGADALLDGRSPRDVHRPEGCRELALLLRSYEFSDDIAFRFSNREWNEYPLTADRFASWLHRLPDESQYVGLFMDYETFGEHQWTDTGIFDFMAHLPRFVLADPRFEFQTPAVVAARHTPVVELRIPRPFSWADEERNLSAWLGNPMQRAAHEALYALAPKVRRAQRRGHAQLFDVWQRLTTSDHVYYMSTKSHSDAEVHEYFTPYESPYDSYVVFMNVLDDLERRVDGVLGAAPRRRGRKRAGQGTKRAARSSRTRGRRT